MSISPDAPNPHFAVRPDWLALHAEPILEPDLPIVDCHHHFWDRSGNRYFFFDLLDDLNSGHNFTATVFMECGAMYRKHGAPEMAPVGETEFANGLAAMSASGAYGSTRIAEGIVGYCDLMLGDRAAPVLEAHMVAGGGRFRGIRNIAAWHVNPAARGSLANPPPGLLADARFRQGLAEVHRLGLCFESFLYHTQIFEFVDLAQAFPDTPMVLNHIGGALGIGPYAGKREEVFENWRAGIRALSNCRNVSVKLTGLGMRLFGFELGARPRPPASSDVAEAWRPYITTLIEAFGPERCMFGSNFPVDKGSCSYAVLWNAFKRIASDLSGDEKAALFHGTASRIYRLQETV